MIKEKKVRDLIKMDFILINKIQEENAYKIFFLSLTQLQKHKKLVNCHFFFKTKLGINL